MQASCGQFCGLNFSAYLLDHSKVKLYEVLTLRERHVMPLENFGRKTISYCFSIKRMLQVMSDGTGAQSDSTIRKVEGGKSPNENSTSWSCNVCCMENSSINKQEYRLLNQRD